MPFWQPKKCIWMMPTGSSSSSFSSASCSSFSFLFLFHFLFLFLCLFRALGLDAFLAAQKMHLDEAPLPLPLPPALERSLGGVRDLLRISLLCWGCFSAVHIVLCIEFLRCCAQHMRCAGKDPGGGPDLLLCWLCCCA